MSYEPPLTGRLVVVVERSASPPSRAPSRLRRGTTEPRIPRLSRPSMACRRNDNVWSSSQRRRGRHRAVALLARALVSGPDPTLSSSDAPRWTPPTPALTSRDDGMRLYRIRSSLDASPVLRLGVSPARRAPPRGADASLDGCPAHDAPADPTTGAPARDARGGSPTPDAPRAARRRPARCWSVTCSSGAPAASQLGRVRITARLRCCDGAAGARPLAPCRTALASPRRRDAACERARAARGDEGGPRGRRRSGAAAARQRASQRQPRGRRHAGRSHAGSAWPAGNLRWGRTCVRKATGAGGRHPWERVFVSIFPEDLAA
jgi:hypothetical protein